MRARAKRLPDGSIFIRIGGAWHNSTAANANDYHVNDMCGGVECGCPICCSGAGVKVVSENEEKN